MTKTERRPTILLVMHNIPTNSGFLATKLIELVKRKDVHLLAWDQQSRVEEFTHKHNLSSSFRNRIHLGFSRYLDSIYFIPWLLALIISNSRLRHYLFSGRKLFKRRLKISLRYLPAISLQPDLIHFEFGTLASDIRDIKELTGAKICVSFRGYDLNFVGLSNSEFYSHVWDQADGIHFLGTDLKNRAARRGYNGKKLEAIIPPGIDVEFYKPSPNRATRSANGKLVILSVGRLTWKKGFEYGIRAAGLLKAKGIPFEYRIVGSGDHLQALEFTIFELGLQKEVFLLGKKSAEDVRQLLSEADVFLHPAVSEGFCNAVLEAQAMGIPVITTDADGLKENIVDGRTGFVVPKWDVDAMAHRLEWCWSNRDELKQMGMAGVQRARTLFRMTDQMQSFQDFYERMLSV